MRVYNYSTQGRGRRVLAAMATNTSVLARIASHWPMEGLFGEDRVSNLIGMWCVDHYQTYQEAPGKALQTRFEQWQEDGDKDLVKLVASALESASALAERGLPSTQVLLDLATEHFDGIAAREAVDQAQAELSRGRTQQATDILDSRRRFDLTGDGVFDPSSDISDWMDAFNEDLQRPLIPYKGALARFLEDDFRRECFVAFMASSSRGKSWWLLDMAYRAVRARNNVAYFEAGDLSKGQMLRRMAQRVLRRPKRAGTVAWPTSFDGTVEGLVTEDRELDAPDPYLAMRAWKRVFQSRDSAFKLHCSANSSLGVADMSGMVAEWALKGWQPDVIICDYADILAPPRGVQDGRDRINENWKALRRLSQQWKCLVVTATQADAGSYSTPLLRRKNFSDDRRKFDHVTGYFALNMTDEEKAAGIVRLNWLKRRDSEYNELQQMSVAGCLACGCPAVLSTLPMRREVEE